MVNIGINGFGRIGKGILRVITDRASTDPMQIVAIKDYNMGVCSNEEYIKNMAYLLANDSIYGRFAKSVDTYEKGLVIDGRKIPVFLNLHMTDIGWDDLGVDILIESSGDLESINHARDCLNNKTRKVIVTRGVPNCDYTMVMGVNEKNYNPDKHHVISSSTCTGNAFAPIAKFVDDHYKIKNGFLQTVHPVLSSEKMLDGFNKSFPVGRATKSIKIISTKVAESTLEVLPHLKDRLSVDAISYRVPTDIVSSVYAVLLVENPVTKKQLIEDLGVAIKSELKGVVDITEGFMGHSLVATDFVRNPHSGILDWHFVSTKDDLLRLTIWHDNEYGYCARVVDIVKYVS